MSLWIKICGLRTEEAIAAAINEGADAIGFVFAPSPRQVTPAEAATLSKRAPATVAKVAVVRRPDQALIDDICNVFHPDLLQIDAEDIPTLDLPHTLALLPVLRATPAAIAALPPRILFEGARSGVGERADWRSASELARRTHLVLAGGLDPDNVADAIAHVAPYGVDVSSGVETSPGVKDPNLIARFIRAARAAEHTTGHASHAG